MPISELELQKAKGKSLAAHFAKAAAHHDKMADHHEKCQKAHEGAAEHHESMLSDAHKATGGDDNFKQHHTAKKNFHKTMASTHEKMHKAHTAHAEHLRSMAKASDLSGEDTKNKPSDTVKAAFAELGIEIEDTPETHIAAKTETPATTTENKTTTSTSTGDPDMSKTETQPVTTTAPTEPNSAIANAAINTAKTAFSGTEEDQAVLGKQFREGLQSALKQGLAEALANPEFKKTVQEQIGNILLSELNKQSLAPTSVKTFAVPRTQTTSESIASGVTPRLSGVENLDPALADLISMGN
jgi:hypothetical protein